MIGVVADDITGANDIGIMFVNGGCTVDIYTYDAPLALSMGKPDVLILDTNSRLDKAKIAYNKVRQATKRLQELGCSLYFNKTCSVFRGNIGSEFDAMLDELNEELAVIVLGFPKNGRQTRAGIHYVRGVPLAQSEFKNDPIHPMNESDLVKILGAQTKRKVGLIEHSVVEKGPRKLKKHIDELGKNFNYLIIDVEDQASLQVIAEAVLDHYIICGSSALGEELPPVLGYTPPFERQLPIPRYDGKGILAIAGSLMPQTRAQIEYAVSHGVIPFELNTVDLISGNRGGIIAELSEEIIREILLGKDVICHSSYEPAVVRKTRELGAEMGLSHSRVGQIISLSLAEIVTNCLAATESTRFLVAGGETSAAICNSLEITGMRVWQEIQAGLPSCYSLGENPKLFVLKSGSFGKPDFFLEAIKHLKEQQGIEEGWV